MRRRTWTTINLKGSTDLFEFECCQAFSGAKMAKNRRSLGVTPTRAGTAEKRVFTDGAGAAVASEGTAPSTAGQTTESRGTTASRLPLPRRRWPATGPEGIRWPRRCRAAASRRPAPCRCRTRTPRCWVSCPAATWPPAWPRPYGGGGGDDDERRARASMGARWRIAAAPERTFRGISRAALLIFPSKRIRLTVPRHSVQVSLFFFSIAVTAGVPPRKKAGVAALINNADIVRCRPPPSLPRQRDGWNEHVNGTTVRTRPVENRGARVGNAVLFVYSIGLR